MKRSIFPIVVLATLILLILSGCKKNTSKTQKLILNEVAHSIFYAPQYVAIEEGYFEAEGIDLVLETGFGADKTMTALISGDADIGFMGSESTIYAFKEGAKDYAINFAGLTRRAGNFLVSREKLDNFNFEMLKGKKIIGGRPGGMPEMVFEYILKKHDIDPAILDIDRNIDYGVTAGAFIGDSSFDFTIEFEPSATEIEKQGKGYIVASLGVESGYIPYTAYCAKKSFIEKNKDTLIAFTKAVNKGLQYVNTHSAKEIAKIIAPQFPDTDEATLITIVSRYKEQDTWKENTKLTSEEFDLLQDILIEANELDEKVSYETLVMNIN